MRTVSNEEFELAYANRDNLNIIHKVCRQYRAQLSQDDLIGCGMLGLWKALIKHKPQFKTKFTTSLWKWTHWECLRELSKKKRLSVKVDARDVNLCFYKNNTVENRAYVLDCLSRLNKEDRKIIKQRFLLSMTFEDIGRANNFSKETARQMFLASIEKLKNVCLTNGV